MAVMSDKGVNDFLPTVNVDGPIISPEKNGFQSDDAVLDLGNGGEGSSQPDIFRCETCGVCFFSTVHLDQHRRQKHATRPPGKFQCALCVYSSNNRGMLARHERTHTGERPFVCELCRQDFTEKNGLRRHHQSVHAETSYECELCGQCFKRSCSLVRHRKLVHTLDAPRFACPQCRRVFTRRDSLKTHMLTHTGERPHNCPTCGVWFAQVGTMRRHERVMHERRYPHHCQHCGHVFSCASNLRRHLTAKHREEREGAAVETA